MKPEEIKAKRKELLKEYSLLQMTDPARAKIIKTKYDRLVKFEKQLEIIDSKLKENESAMEITLGNIDYYNGKLNILRENLIINENEISGLKDTISNLKEIDKENLEIEKGNLEKQKNKFLKDNLKFLRELKIEIEEERITESKSEILVVETALTELPTMPATEKINSDEESSALTQ